MTDSSDNQTTTPAAAEPKAVLTSAPGAAAHASSAEQAASREHTTLEKLAQAVLHEQRASRRWRIFFRAAWLLFLIAVFSLYWNQGSAVKSAGGPHTAVVQIKGEIASDTDASADLIFPALRAAFSDPDARGVVLLISSPGGSPVQAGIINDEILRLKALHKKPVYAVVEESCASAAYYIAVAADKIYVDKASLVGSIGVLMDGFGFVDLLQRLGVERRLLTAGENKGFLDPFSPQSERQRAHAQAILDQIHQQFIDAVKAGRGPRLKQDPDIFSGLFWNGQQAVELGLADQLGSLDYVAREVIKAEDVLDYSHQENLFERAARRFGVALGTAALNTIQTSLPLR